jgi:putative CocE/NonD family hydrolase
MIRLMKSGIARPRVVVTWLTLTGLLSPAATPAAAQAPNPGTYSAARYQLTERRGVMVPMRDSARLAVDLYLPSPAEKRPAVLAITPYGRTELRAKARWYAQRGYAFIAADSRGRFDSEGVWDPFGAKHKIDGYDLVEWLARQPWSNGKVGMWGGSYLGWTQWWTASEAPPHLAAIAPLVTPSDQFENGPYQYGALTGGWMPDWAAMMSGRTFQIVDDGPYGGWIKRRRADFRHTPYAEINTYRGIESAPWFTEWYRQNKSTDPYWKGIAYQGEEHYSKVTVPSLAVTGWFDVSHPGSPTNYLGMKRFGATPEARRPSLVIGPWTHGINQRVVGGIDYGPEATIDLEGYVVRWFDHFLQGVDNGIDKDPPVYLFVMGENKWHAEKDWPLPGTQLTKYYLTSGGRANSLNGNGVLTTTPPGRDTSDSYTYDPRNPTPDPSTSLENHNGHLDGAVDTRSSAARDEVLVYQTTPLESPVEVTGPIEATLYAGTSALDTDWMVRLVDVEPDGRALLLADGVLRARNRDPTNEGRFNSAELSRIEPGKAYQYTIRFWRGTANLFRPGHRIRVEISSSWSPFFLPNLNTGADNLAMVSLSSAVVARQTVHHGPRSPSHVLLPVIPTRPRADVR